MIGLYKLSREDKKQFRENMLRISKKWSPYRTYACMHLWRWRTTRRLKKKILKSRKAMIIIGFSASINSNTFS
jgi:3-methyladenine DNA glycosylase/8-oxoguanine DNA glycosylase